MPSPKYLSTVPFAALKIVVRRISVRTQLPREGAPAGVETRLPACAGVAHHLIFLAGWGDPDFFFFWLSNRE